MALQIFVNTGTGKGLLPDGTKPLSEPMLIQRKTFQLNFIGNTKYFNQGN